MWRVLVKGTEYKLFLFTFERAFLAVNLQKVPDRVEATWKALIRALKLFLLGVFLQGIITNSQFEYFLLVNAMHLCGTWNMV